MAASDLTTPERYELIDRIAVGGMAEVFRAVAYGAHGFEKTLAIKRILPELARDPEFEERFIGEAKLAVKLSHANVVQVLDFGRMAGTLFIALELVDGLDLAALLRRYRDLGKLIPIPAAFHIAVEIARGLDFAHQHGVVHRDVSPSNILISRAGEVKIADFGIAQAAGDRRAIAADRRRIMGKWRYMSPEQALGEALGTRSDLFSAAAVWFEMFTGEKLFPGDEADQIIDHICHMPIPSASDRRRGLPPRLDDVLRQALERDPDRRPDKASDVLRALVEISYESSIVATALDVAAAVQEALEATARLADGSLPPRPLDEHIRGQLQPLDESVRLTAVGNAPAEGEPGGAAGSSSAMPRADGGSNGEVGRTSHAPSEGMTGEHSTGITLVKRGVDPDGVTHWELDADAVGGEDTDRLTMAAAPAALRTGRRPSDAPPSTAEDEEEERVAGPRLLRRAARVALFALVTAGGGAALAWQMGALGSEPDRRAPAAVRPPAEAATLPAAATLAVLVIDSIPSGARVRLDGRQLPEPTPTSAEIAPRVAHVVELEREGYRRYVDEGVSSRSGETVRITPPLLAERASLSVITVPPGAEVSLDGEVLGETPLHRDDLRPGRDRRLTLRKQDFKPIDLTVEMVDGLRSEIKKRLESAIVHGRIMINLPDTWADVSDSGKRVGRVGIGTSGVLRLPVGHHRLKFYNRESKRERMVEVEVVAGEDRLYNVEL